MSVAASAFSGAGTGCVAGVEGLALDAQLHGTGLAAGNIRFPFLLVSLARAPLMSSRDLAIFVRPGGHEPLIVYLSTSFLSDTTADFA